MLIERQGGVFNIIRGGDTDRDGMFLELFEAGSLCSLMEVFYFDADDSFSICGFGGSVPLAVAAEFIATAERLLPSSSKD